MKRVLVAAAACVALGAWGQPAKQGTPTQVDYDALMKSLSSAAQENPKKKLGPIDQWRYDSCRSEAAKAPTERGVGVSLQLCREKFGQ